MVSPNHVAPDEEEKRHVDDLTKRPLSRRDALKALAGITGAVAISSLPSKWATPLVDVGALPAHAQCSPTGTTAAVEIFNATDGNALVEVFYGDEESKSMQIGVLGYGCIDGITPGPGEICVTVTGGHCPGHDCEEGTFVAGELVSWEIYCGGTLGDGPGLKKN